MITWSDSFSTGIELVDTQHKKLFELLNNVADGYNQGDANEAIIDNALNQLIAYADKHFTEE